MKGSKAVWLICVLQRVRGEAKMADKRQSGSVGVVLEERKAAKGKCLVGCQGVAGGWGRQKGGRRTSRRLRETDEEEFGEVAGVCCKGSARDREMTLKGRRVALAVLCVQRDRVGSKNGRQRRMGAVRVVP